METVALKVANELWNGANVAPACEAHPHRAERIGNSTAYTFEDGSRIVWDGAGGWDEGFEGADCACWANEGHVENCANFS